MGNVMDTFGSREFEKAFEETARGGLIARFQIDETYPDNPGRGHDVTYLVAAGIGIGPLRSVDAPTFKVAIPAKRVSSAWVDVHDTYEIGAVPFEKIENKIIPANNFAIVNPFLDQKHIITGADILLSTTHEAGNVLRSALTITGDDLIDDFVAELERRNDKGQTLAKLSRVALSELWLNRAS